MRYALLAALVLTLVGCDAPNPAAQATEPNSPGAVHGLPVDSFDPASAAACQLGCAAPLDDYSPSEVADQPDAPVGSVARCPVSGVVFRVTDESPSVEYAGHQYRTCCGGCADKLRAELAATL